MPYNEIAPVILVITCHHVNLLQHIDYVPLPLFALLTTQS